MTHTLVLGAGFGGLTAATELARRLPSGHPVTLVDRKATFLMGLSKLWMLDGRRRAGEGARRIEDVARRGVRFVRGDITRIDLAHRAVAVGTQRLAFDRLVIALGAELAPDALPGLPEAIARGVAHNLYDPAGVETLHGALARVASGARVLFLVTGVPFKCPPAPYEAAMLAKSFLAARGVDAEVAIASPEPQPLPVAGKECGDTVREWVEERGVVVENGRKPVAVDAARKVVRFEDGGERAFDLLAAVPAHRAPSVLADAGLLGEAGWVPADAGTLATRHEDVWCVGDSNVVKLANGKPLVKAGVMAEGEALVVAGNLAARALGEPETARFAGKGHCFLELGDGLAVEVRGDFYATPNPVVVATLPSDEALRAKEAFEAERLARWFGD